MQAENKAVLAIQGGALLGGYSWGSLNHILGHWNLDIRAIAGTSIGGAVVLVLNNGLSLPTPELRNAAALHDLNSFWERLPKFLHQKLLPLIAGYVVRDIGERTRSLVNSWTEAWLSLARAPVGGFGESIVASFEHASHAVFPQTQVLIQHSLMGEFIRAEQLLDFKAIERSPILTIINATRVEAGQNPFAAVPEQEQIFSNHEHDPEWMPITLNAVEATGNLHYLEENPTEIDNRFYRDGAFVSNPPLMPLAAFAELNGIKDVLLLRTRPTDSLINEQTQLPSTQDQIRAFFNGQTDNQLRAVARAYPTLRFIVIEPSHLEVQRDVHRPEFNFENTTLLRRHNTGFRAAAMALQLMSNGANAKAGIYVISDRHAYRLTNPLLPEAGQLRTASAGARPGG